MRSGERARRRRDEGEEEKKSVDRWRRERDGQERDGGNEGTKTSGKRRKKDQKEG